MNQDTTDYDSLKKTFSGFSKFYHPLSLISADREHNIVLCDSQCKAYNFDGIIRKEARHRRVNPFCTVDAISFQSGYVNFIEFKNSKLSDVEKYTLYLKIAESYRWFEKVLLDSRWLDKLGVQTRFILVYNPEKVGNGPGSYRSIDDTVHGLAQDTGSKKSRGSSIQSKLARIVEVCGWLKYFDDIKFMTADDFTKNVGRYC